MDALIAPRNNSDQPTFGAAKHRQAAGYTLVLVVQSPVRPSGAMGALPESGTRYRPGGAHLAQTSDASTLVKHRITCGFWHPVSFAVVAAAYWPDRSGHNAGIAPYFYVSRASIDLFKLNDVSQYVISSTFGIQSAWDQPPVLAYCKAYCFVAF